MNIWNIFASPCTGRNGRIIKIYDFLADAESAAIKVSKHNKEGKTFEAYKCNTCEAFHIRPKRTFEKPYKCGHCRSKDGSKKNLYATEADAQIILEDRKAKTAINFEVYSCPYQQGFHLKKRSSIF